ncbi:hypothetical protein DXG01_001021 [Tephrocybe rancida]|nr:hypothetical protein DXG01_001021 [Tephrocybe rancida]
MPPGPKSIFRQPGAKHFQLVHRSQRDPLIHDPDASQHVLKPIERENAKKGKSRADLESILSSSETSNDKLANVGEASLYGVYYDDTEYNYMQHLRAVGIQEEGVESVLIEAPSTSKSSKAAAKKSIGIEIRDLPQGVLASKSELPRTYESQQAVPESIAGFQPDMDPHLRQVLEALEDDAFVNDDLEDDFFGELVADGERQSDEEVEFDFEEDSYEAPSGSKAEGDEEPGWEERFAQFKKAQKKNQAQSDDGYDGSEGGDTVGTLPAISVIGGKKRRKGTSDASGYSMSSSSMYRNEALQTLDERFDQIIIKQYADDDDDTPSSDEENDPDEAPELITSRDDFESMMNEFLNDYEILGRKMKQKLDGDTGAEKLDTIRRALGQDERVRLDDQEDDDDDDDILMPFDVDDKKDRWDCETILSTYSNLENHPRLIRARDPRPVAKITLDPKTGFPTVVDHQPKSQVKKAAGGRATYQESDSDSGSETDTPGKRYRFHTLSTLFIKVVARQTITRPRDESRDEKKARKAAVKAIRQARRIEKKTTTEQFGSELKIQKRTIANKEKRLKKLMAFTPNLSNTLLLLTIIVVLLPVETYAFGAGDIPDFAYLNDKAFRHGDIESILENLVKSAGGAAAGGGLLGFAQSVIQSASGGAKFSKSDIKKVYFVSRGIYNSKNKCLPALKGNWLRDYSQCMDIAGLSKLTADTLVLVVSVLGFVTFGFATEEFQVTADRLGVYLPVEHIDNPKGYAEKEGDARGFHPKLRPPVDRRELEIDARTGMKNYMATENKGWDTSTAFIRRTFRACIEAGRRAGGQEGAQLYEAYRLLGTGLHTMEDLLAHSNWCEVALRKLGHKEVFCHVGDNVIVNTPNGPAPPLITGTFGGADFIYSLMGEATDEDNISKIKNILSQLPIGGGDDKVNQGEQMNAAAKAYNFNPDNVAPPEVQQQLLALLKWRDQVYRDVVSKIEMVPGLASLLDELTNALNAYVYTILSPYIVPLLQQATGVLGEGSKSVINSEDQYEVFDNPNASDPSHSFLSKDHFDLILNEPAGKIAQLVVENSVNLIVQAWAQDSNPDEVINRILEAFHHPYYATGRSEIQRQMFDHMERWIGGLGHEATEILQRLTKDSVRNARNKRPGSENESHDETAGYGGQSHNHGGTTYKPSGGYQSQQGQGQYGGMRSDGSNQYGSGNQYGSSNQRKPESQYGSGNEYSSSGNQYGRSDSSNQYGSGNQYGSSNQRKPESQYGSGNEYSSSGNQYASTNTHGSGRKNEEGGYGSSNQRSSSGNQYGSTNTYGSGRNEESAYGAKNEYSSGHTASGGSPSQGYGQTESRRSENQSSGYGSRTETRQGESESYYGRSGKEDRERGGNEQHGRGGHQQDEGGYGSRRTDNENTSGRTTYGESENRHRSNEGRTGYGGSQQEESYGSRRSDNEYSSGNTQSYGQGGYGSGRKQEHENEESKHHRRNDSNDSDDKDRRREKRSSQEGTRGGYAPSYGGGYDGGRTEERSYGGSGYGNKDETYGVERLRVGKDNDDDDDDEKKRRRHHRKRDSD